MTESEIIRHINDGANFYISLFGEADHMEKHDTGTYSIIHPKVGEEGISFIYNIRVNDLDAASQQAVAQEIRSLHMPFWLDLSASDDVFRLFFGADKQHGQNEFSFNDEQYMALFPEQFVMSPACHSVVEVRTSEEFSTWAKLANELLADGRRDIHEVHHFPLIDKGLLRCYLLYVDGKAVSVAATMQHHGIASLELVGTLHDYRCKGLARAVCATAVQNAFAAGASIVTVRANSIVSAHVYRSLGFQTYNYAL